MPPYRICDRAPEFNRQDPEDPTICFGEIDVYARDPRALAREQHGLTIRRRWRDGGPSAWELVRVYYPGAGPGEAGSVVVVEEGTLGAVCARVDEEWNRAWGHLTGAGSINGHAPCEHVQDARSSRCGAVDRVAVVREQLAETEAALEEANAQLPPHRRVSP